MLAKLSFCFTALLTLLTFSPVCAQTTEIVFGTSRTIFNLSIWMALDRGFFRDNGLDVREEVIDSVDREQRMLHEGALQIAISAPEAVIAESFNAGSSVVIAGNAERLPRFIIVNPRIRSLADLKGARVGVAGASEGTTSLMSDIAKAGGLAASDFDIQVVGARRLAPVYCRRGRLTWAFNPFRKATRPRVKVLETSAQCFDIVPYQFTALVVQSRCAQENRPPVMSFLRALEEGNIAMQDADAAAAMIAAREMRTTADLATRYAARSCLAIFQSRGFRSSEYPRRCMIVTASQRTPVLSGLNMSMKAISQTVGLSARDSVAFSAESRINSAPMESLRFRRK